jgi:acylphosphatase
VTGSSTRLVVSGRVQGVGFRQFIARRAAAAGVRGWVRNLADGRVEMVVAGSTAAVGEMRRAAREGPPMAVVTQVDELAEDATDGLMDSFQII